MALLAVVLWPCKLLVPRLKTRQKFRAPEFTVEGDGHAARRRRIEPQHHHFIPGLKLCGVACNRLAQLQAESLTGIGMANIAAREHALLAYATPRLAAVPGLRIIGNAPDKAAVVSFLVEGAHAHDLATLLDLEGVAVRSGHHCAHPLMHFFGVPATLRASLAFYNTHEEVEAFVAALRKTRTLLA